MRKHYLGLFLIVIIISLLSCKKEPDIPVKPTDNDIVLTDNFTGKISDDLNLDMSSVIVSSELDTSTVTTVGNFKVASHSTLMAVNKKTNKPVFFGYPGSDEKTNYILNAKETALYFAVLAIPHIRRPYFQPYISSIKRAIYQLQEVKDLEQNIIDCIKSKGYLDYDIIGASVGTATDKVATITGLSTISQSQVRMNANSLVTIGNTYAATGGYYRIDDKLPDNWNDSYDSSTKTYTLRRKMYNSTPAVVGVSMGKYNASEAKVTPLKEYIGFIEPYYPPNLASVKGNIDNLKQLYEATTDLFKKGLKDGLENTDAYSKDNTFQFKAIQGEKDAIVFDCGYLDPKVMQGINIAYLFIDNFQDIFEDEAFTGKNLFVKSDYINDFLGDLASDALNAAEIGNYVIWFQNGNYDLIAGSLEKLLTKFNDKYFFKNENLMGFRKHFEDMLTKRFKELVGPIATVYKYSRITYKLLTNIVVTDSKNFTGAIPIAFDKLQYPPVPNNPFPYNVSLPNFTAITFKWDINNSDNQTLTYSIYLSKSKEELINGKVNCLLTSNITSKEYTPNYSLLSSNTHYYWQVEVVNSNGNKILSPVWDFIVGKTTVDLSDGLVAYYPFNGNANDESGNGNNGTVNGATLTTDRKGKENSAYSFDGGSNCIYIKNSSSLNFQDECTMSIWSNINNNGIDKYNTYLAKSHDTNGFAIGGGPTNQQTYNTHVATFASWGNTNGQKFIGVGIEKNYLNSWVNVVYVFSKTSSKIFVNGELVHTSTFIADFSVANTQDIYIGKFSDYWWPMNGLIDDIRIYNRALSDTEVQALYNE